MFEVIGESGEDEFQDPPYLANSERRTCSGGLVKRNPPSFHAWRVSYGTWLFCKLVEGCEHCRDGNQRSYCNSDEHPATFYWDGFDDSTEQTPSDSPCCNTQNNSESGEHGLSGLSGVHGVAFPLWRLSVTKNNPSFL